MRGKGIGIIVWIACLLCVLASTAGVSAQSRKQINISAPGSRTQRTVGERSSLQRFNKYSYGLGGLSSPMPGKGGNTLNASIPGLGRRSANRSTKTPAGGAALPDIGKAPSGGQMYRSSAMIVPQVAQPTGKTFSETLTGGKETVYASAQSYLSLMDEISESDLVDPNQPVTSMVPQDPSPYATYMEDGERAMKAGDFLRACNEFRLANRLSDKDPERLLSLSQASFAKSLFSFGEAAFYLRRALKYFPELPLVPLRPKAFFGDTPIGASRYAERILLLEDHTKKLPTDTDAQLLLAYFRWFEGDVEATQKALSLALASAQQAKDLDMVEVIEIFWDGMLATGKVSGQLMPAASQERSSQPAGGEA